MLPSNSNDPNNFYGSNYNMNIDPNNFNQNYNTGLTGGMIGMDGMNNGYGQSMQNMQNMQNMNFTNYAMPNFSNTGYNVPQQNPDYNNSLLNNSQNNFNNSLSNMNPMNYGMMGNVGTQYGVPYGNTQYNQGNLSGSNFQQGMGMNMLYPPNMQMMGQSGQSLSNSLLAQINQMNLEQIQRFQEQEEVARKEKEEESEFKMKFKEEIQKMLLEKVDLEKIKNIDLHLPKSEYFYERDRSFFEELIQQPLKSEGLFGTELVKTIDKSALYKSNNAITSYTHSNNIPDQEYFSKMTIDGVYIDYIKQLIYSYNLQKTEQRLLRENKTEWFKPNGDLRLENDIFSDVITKPIDISLSTNEKFKTHYLNSALCSRSSERNFKRYKMKLFISKIFFKYHPLFIEEDILCSELRESYKDYYKLMNSINIPYIKEKIMIISKRLDEYSQVKDPSEAIKLEIKNMKMFVKDSMDSLEKSKKSLNEKANLLYNKWLELKMLRERQKYQSTSLKLNVIRFPSKTQENPNIFDYAFVLSHSEPTNDELTLPKTEKDRRLKIKGLTFYLKIFVNDIFVAESKKYAVQWPNFEIDINNLFLLNVYSRPTKIEIEIYAGRYSFKKITKFEIEPPGVYMSTVTSSSALFEELEFQSTNVQSENKINNNPDYTNTLVSKDFKNDEVDELLKKENKTEVQIKKEKIYKGRIYLKTEWEGQAPDLPPTKIEDKVNLLNRQKDFKINVKKINNYDFPYDINDPRNVTFFEEMKKAKTELLLKYLSKEYNLPFYDLRSLRQYLLAKRLEKFSLNKFKIPFLESEIQNNPDVKALLKDLENEKPVDETEYEKKIKDQLEKLNNIYSERILTDDEYYEVLSKKIRTMKRDIVNRLQMSYFQIVSEYFNNSTWKLLIQDLCYTFLTPARKMAPKRKRITAVKVEKTSEINVNIHVVKGYNVPVRNESIPASIREKIKGYAIGQAYKSQLGLYQSGINNQLIKRELALSANLKGGQGLSNNQFGNMGNMGNVFNNSGNFGSPGVMTHNQSLVGNVNMNNMNPYMNPNLNTNLNYNVSNQGIPNMMSENQFNPNLNNVMFNPNSQNIFPMYNQPNNQMLIPSQIKNYDGDILQMVDILRNLEQNIDSFVQVKMSYYDTEQIMRTDSLDGLHPDFNYKMQFKIKPRNGEQYFSREEITKCPGSFYFSLYDEFRTEEKIQEKDANTYIYRYEKKYLGSFEIPFTTIFQNANLLETMCKVNVPLTVFGYYSDTSSAFDVLQGKEDDLRKKETISKEGEENNNSKSSFRIVDETPRIVNPYVNTYLSLYITMDPVPSFNKNDELDYVPGFEDSVFLINATKWLKKIKQNPLLINRNIKLFAENFDGYSVFLSRYIKPGGQKPPEIVFDEINAPDDYYSIEKAARYVSLIPFIEDSHTFEEDMPDCWCTDEQFLTLGFGDYEEHAILLCNYFNYIDAFQKKGKVSNYLVLGQAYPEGQSIYVMRVSNETPDVEFWNAKTGECFYFDKRYHENKFLCFTINKSFNLTRASSDSICQLNDIGCIITQNNIYVNTQSIADPGVIDFDLKNTKNWIPFLNEISRKKYFPDGIATIQRDLIYEQPTSDASHNLKLQIFNYLKQQIEISRASKDEDGKPLRTRWERTANEKIENILCDYDGFFFTHKQSGVDVKI
jgi:hypothetical protein